MAPMTQVLSSSLGLAPHSYIYKLLSTSPRYDPQTYNTTDTLAVVSSDDSLRLLDPATLKLLPDGLVKVNESVTCLERVDDVASNLIATAGRDGFVNYWDKRSQGKALSIQSPHKLISSLVCNAPRNFVACGIENPDDGPGVSPVYVWDQRNSSAPLLSLVESHTDTVTSLELHPDLPTLLLSASTDGLVNIFDCSKPDEEDALYQVINHRSAVAQAGFMLPSTDVYAFGTDETMAFYALQSQNEDEEEPPPKLFGDIREKLGCEYLAKMHWVGDDAYIAAGKHSDSHYLDLIPIEKSLSGTPLQYEYDLEMSIRLEGAHSEEVVRDLFTDVHSHTTYTVGEDSHIRSWKMPDDEGMDVDDEAESAQKQIKDAPSSSKKDRRKEKKEKRKGDTGEKVRYKPY